MNDELAICELRLVSKVLVAASRPNTLFERYIYDLRTKIKELKKEWEDQAGVKLQNILFKDLRSKGVKVLDGELKMGRYRGSGFVTSFKLKVRVESEKSAKELLDYLKEKYSPKWKLKSVEAGVAKYNVR